MLLICHLTRVCLIMIKNCDIPPTLWHFWFDQDTFIGRALAWPGIQMGSHEENNYANRTNWLDNYKQVNLCMYFVFVHLYRSRVVHIKPLSRPSHTIQRDTSSRVNNHSVSSQSYATVKLDRDTGMDRVEPFVIMSPSSSISVAIIKYTTIMQ